MSKLKTLDIQEIFKHDALRILGARSMGKLIHSTNDIKAAGNELENEFRKFLTNRMPNKYYIGHGHIIDREEKISPQLDVIVSDNSALPILLKANDGTEYFTSESVYAIGEIKSAYYKSEKPIQKFCETIKLLESQMIREKRENTFVDGKLKDSTLLIDTIFRSPNKVLNEIYSFMVFCEKKEFKSSDFQYCVDNFERKYLPNHIFFLDKGTVTYGKVTKNNTTNYKRYPAHSKEKDEKWLLLPLGNPDNIAGNQLAFLYYNLLDHVSKSSIEPQSFMPYFKKLFTTIKGSVEEMKNEA